jgi:hypothetical protein
MENQKIQQLIRLASIADKNGDYKIADKLFTKIAALPPILTGQTPAQIDKYLTTLLKDIEKFQNGLETLQVFASKFKDKRFGLFATMTDSEMEAAFRSYQDSLKSIKYWETTKAQKLKDLKATTDPGTRSSIEAEIGILEGDIDAAEKSIEQLQYKAFFGDAKKAPLSPTETNEKIKELKEQLEELVPNLDKLASQNIDINKLTAFFSKINTDKARKALEKLRSTSGTAQTPDIQGVINKFNSLISRAKAAVRNNPDLTETPNNIYIQMEKIDGKFIKSSGLNRDDIIKFIEDGRIDPDKIMSIKSQSKIKKFFSSIPDGGKSLFNEFIKLRKARKSIPKQHPFYSLQAVKAYTSGVWDLSKAELYGDNFIDFIKQLDIRFAEAYAQEVEKIKIRDKVYSAQNPKQFNEAFSNAQVSVKSTSPEAVAITNLFAAMKDKFKVLQDTAERILIQQGEITKPKENLQRIYEKMTELDGRFFKTTGLSRNSIDKMMMSDNLSIEEFLKLEGKILIPNVKNETFMLILAAMGISIYAFKDALIIPKTLEFLRRKLFPSAFERDNAKPQPAKPVKPAKPDTSGLDAFDRL